MAIIGRGREADLAGRSGAAATPSTGSAGPGGLTAFIDQGSEFEGKLSFRDTVRIDGSFRGEITSENNLIVGETGEIEATIRSKTIAVSGTVHGDVHASQKAVLHKTARVEGNVHAPSLIVEEGAFVNGQITMTRPDGKQTGSSKAATGGSSKSGSDSSGGGRSDQS